jgi:hypothetical protein
MVDDNGAWGRQGEAFWRAHHEAWKRSDLNQRQYCEAEGIPLKAFGNWRSKFKAEPQPPERKLLYRRRGLSPPFSPRLSPPLSPRLSPGTYPSSSAAGPIVPRPREGHRRRFSDADKHAVVYIRFRFANHQRVGRYKARPRRRLRLYRKTERPPCS